MAIQLENFYEQAGGGGSSLLTPESKGAVGNGSTDDTVALQACATQASSTGETIYLAPNKTYKFTSKITSTAAHAMVGDRTSILLMSGDFASDGWVFDSSTFSYADGDGGGPVPTFQPQDQANPDTGVIVGAILQGFTIEADTLQSAGGAFAFNWSWWTTIRDVQFGSHADRHLNVGLAFNFAGLFYVDNCNFYYNLNGIFYAGARGGGCGYGGRIMGGDFYGPNDDNSHGIHVCGGFGGVTIGLNANIGTSGHAIYAQVNATDPLGSGKTLDNGRELFVTDITADTNVHTGLFVEDGAVTTLRLNNSWFAGNGDLGASISGVTRFNIDGCYFFDNNASGTPPVDLTLDDMGIVRIGGTDFYGSINIIGSSIDTLAITGGRCTSILGTATTYQVKSVLGLTDITNPQVTTSTVYAAGSVYTLTASDALTHFGTTDPTITVTPGTYIIQARVTAIYNAATYIANQTITAHLRKTSGTSADVANGTTTEKLRIITTVTDSVGSMVIPSVVYTTMSNDTISIYSSVSATPSAGSVQITEASILAIKIL